MVTAAFIGWIQPTGPPSNAAALIATIIDAQSAWRLVFPNTRQQKTFGHVVATVAPFESCQE